MSCSDRETKRRADHREGRLRAWHATGSLYSPRAEAWLTQRIRAAFAVEFGPVRESTEAPGDVEEAGEGATALRGDGRAMTLDEVGAALRLSRERVRQIEVKALAKMGEALKLLARTEGRGARR